MASNKQQKDTDTELESISTSEETETSSESEPEEEVEQKTEKKKKQEDSPDKVEIAVDNDDKKETEEKPVEIDEELDPVYVENGKKSKVPIWKKFKKSQNQTQWEVFPRVYVNNAEKNGTKGFPSNKISTTKYTLLTFLPKNLIEQFSKGINVWFLLITIVTAIPQISPLNPVTSIVPLLFVLIVNALKEAYEDFMRYRADRVTNSRLYTILSPTGEEIQIESEKLKVGQIMLLKKEELVPADVVLMSTSLQGGICYIETAQLDGETNLKIYSAPTQVAKIPKETLLKINGWIETKIPDVNLYKFVGKFVNAENNQQREVSLDTKNLLLRGCKLRNTEWVIGCVIYTGKDTKLSLNQKNPPFKLSTVERVMNKLVGAMFIFMFICTVIMTIMAAVFQIDAAGRSYLADDTSIGFVILKSFFAYLILFSFFLPQSMIVTLELVKVIQTKLMDWDIEMRVVKDDPTTGMIAKTSNLNDELGLVKYIFSDKTGTLTQNKMEFAKCSVNGKNFENPIKEELKQFIKHKTWTPPSTTESICEPIGSTKATDLDYVLEFLFALAVCHTAVASHDEATGDYKYEAQSPDEVALCVCAKVNGFTFIKNESDITYLDVLGHKMTFKVLNCMEFTSERARMSIIVQCPDGKIKLYMKGADSMMLKLASTKNPVTLKLKEKIIKDLDKFSVEGLRTLIVAVRELSQKEFDTYNEKFHKANTSLKDRDTLVKAAAAEIEKEMEIIGCTAIEDKLQDGVPDTIDYFLQAGVKVWVITGDKQETAINIGKSTKLLKNEQPLIVINVKEKDDQGKPLKEDLISKDCEALLQNGINKYKNSDQHPGLVINGMSLTFALNDWPELFLQLAELCNSVVCCRVTPFQKASIVRLVKTTKKEICLSIGDGANDVSMIQEAHIGVGIFGREGTQAARASDYAIQQFSHLKRLVAVHGRYSFLRNTSLIETSLYKNLAYFFAQFWFGLFSGQSGVTVVDDYLVTFYNILFTSALPFFIGFQEKDISEQTINDNPGAYKSIDKMYTLWGIFLGQFAALYHSLIFFGVATLIFETPTLLPAGYSFGLESYGGMIATYAVWTSILRIALVTKYWTGITIFFNLLSLLAFYIVYIAISSIGAAWPAGEGVIQILFTVPAYWLGIPLAVIAALIVDFCFFAAQRYFYPTPAQILQEEFFNNKKRRGNKVSDAITLVEVPRSKRRADD